ncbi:hypothetical protein [Microcoleus sp. B9-D4]
MVRWGAPWILLLPLPSHNSQQSTVNSQQPTVNSQQSTANSQLTSKHRH